MREGSITSRGRRFPLESKAALSWENITMGVAHTPPFNIAKTGMKANEMTNAGRVLLK
jgi:hypothetical protein